MKKLQSIFVLIISILLISPAVFATDTDGSITSSDSATESDENTSDNWENNDTINTPWTSLRDGIKPVVKPVITNVKPMPINFVPTDSTIKEEMEKRKEEIKQLRAEKVEAITNNREEIKGNLEDFRSERKAFVEENTLTKEQKEEIAQLKKELGEETKALLEKLREESDPVKRKEILEEIEDITFKYLEKIKEISWANEDVNTLVEKRKAVIEANMNLRIENLNTRKEYIDVKVALIEEYKEKFMNRLKAMLDNIAPEKLEKVIARIDKLEENIRNNEKLTDEKREKLLAQIVALREIIENKMDEYQITNDEIDLEALFAD